MNALLARPLRLAAVLLYLTALAACSKKEDAGPAPGISWTLNGSDERVSAVSSPVSATSVELIGYRLTSTATSSSTTAVIFLTMPKKIGTYTLKNNNGAATAEYGGDEQLYLDTTGTITVTDLTATTITGTFSFTGADTLSPGSTRTITNGQFSVAL